jgi:ribosomal protein L44E
MSDEYRPYNNNTIFQTQSKSYMGYSPITKDELLKAQSLAYSSAHASRILGVTYKTYRKYCKKYDVPHLVEIQTKKIQRYNKNTEQKLNDVLEGEYPNYTPHLLKERLVNSGVINAECSNCGFCERRVTDEKSPLLLDFIDGNKQNHRWENLRLLCYNCYFLLVGNVVGRRRSMIKEEDEEIDLSLL